MNKGNTLLILFGVILLFSIGVANAYANPATVNLGEAGNFAVLSKAAISDTVPTATHITGDIGVSPAAATLITGIDCTEVVGTIHVVSSGGATSSCQTVDPAYLTPTIGNMEAAYTDALSRSYDVTLDGSIGGMTLTPGVYFTASSLGIPTDVNLDCTSTGSSGVFIFRIGGNLDLAASKHVNLIGCQSGNIFWAVAGTTTIGGGVGTESTFEGTVLGGPDTSEIAVVTGSTVHGRLLGQKGIALDQNIITKPTSTPPTTGPVFIDMNPTNGILDSGESSFDTIQQAITAATSGDTIHVTAGTYTETGQIVIDKDLTIIGADKATTIIKTNQDTTNSGDSKGWFLVNSGITFNLQNVTLDGSGYKIFQAIRDFGIGTIEDCKFTNIKYNPSGPDYAGTAIVAFMGSSGSVDVKNSEFSEIGRVGILYYGSGKTGTYSGNTYTGKGIGNWLDYGVEVGAGAQATISDNTISNCKGVATVDGSTSAGIIATTYYGSGTQATITGNTISDSTDGVGIGYDSSDTSIVTAHNNKFIGIITHGVDSASTTQSVNAENNWWGTNIGSIIATKVSANVDYQPYYVDSAMTTLSSTTPSTVYVNGTYTDGSAGSHIFGYDAFNKIQDGINAVAISGTVNIAAGTYDERIEITKPLNLIGAGVGNSIIDATSFVVQGDVIKITTLTGNTKIEGFDIKTGDYSNGIVSNGGTDAAGTIEIKNNHIISTNSVLADNQFGIIAGYGDVRKLIISGNQISDTYSNSILVEKQAGETEITNNLLNGAFPSIFFMTYGGLDVTALQKVNNNIIEMKDADPTWYGSAITFNGARRNVPLESLGLGKYTNIVITGNIIKNLSVTALNTYKGIHLVNDDPAGTGGEITGAIISGNQISGFTGNNAVGIKLSGKITNTVISGNIISGLSIGFLGVTNNNGAGTQYPSTTTLSDKNSISGNTAEVNWPSSSPLLNAENNYWSNETSDASLFSANVDYTPWYTNVEMTTLSDATVTDATYTSPTDGQADLPAGATEVTLTDTTVMNVSSGVNTESGGNIIIGGESLALNGGVMSGVDLTLAQEIGDQSVTIDQAVTLQSGVNGTDITLTNSDLSDVSLSIPDGTTVLAPSGWDGTIEPPKTVTSTGTAPSGFSVGGTVIEVGSPGNVLLFDTPVTILLTGVTGSVGYKPAGSSVWVQITNTCGGTYASPASPSFPGECYISLGGNTKIVTYHLTTFGSLDAISTSSAATTTASNPSGVYSCGDWGACTDGKQSRTCTSGGGAPYTVTSDCTATTTPTTTPAAPVSSNTTGPNVADKLVPYVPPTTEGSVPENTGNAITGNVPNVPEKSTGMSGWLVAAIVLGVIIVIGAAYTFFIRKPK